MSAVYWIAAAVELVFVCVTMSQPHKGGRDGVAQAIAAMFGFGLAVLLVMAARA